MGGIEVWGSWADGWFVGVTFSFTGEDGGFIGCFDTSFVVTDALRAAI